MHQGSLSLPCHSKLDFTFVRCLISGSRIFTGIASAATEIRFRAGHGSAKQKPALNTWQEAAKASPVSICGCRWYMKRSDYGN